MCFSSIYILDYDLNSSIIWYLYHFEHITYTIKLDINIDFFLEAMWYLYFHIGFYYLVMSIIFFNIGSLI